jgi:hypothetical protein
VKAKPQTISVELTKMEIDYLISLLGAKSALDWGKKKMMLRIAVVNGCTSKLSATNPRLYDGEPIRSTELGNA